MWRGERTTITTVTTLTTHHGPRAATADRRLGDGQTSSQGNSSALDCSNIRTSDICHQLSEISNYSSLLKKMSLIRTGVKRFQVRDLNDHVTLVGKLFKLQARYISVLSAISSQSELFGTIAKILPN